MVRVGGTKVSRVGGGDFVGVRRSVGQAQIVVEVCRDGSRIDGSAITPTRLAVHIVPSEVRRGTGRLGPGEGYPSVPDQGFQIRRRVRRNRIVEGDGPLR